MLKRKDCDTVARLHVITSKCRKRSTPSLRARQIGSKNDTISVPAQRSALSSCNSESEALDLFMFYLDLANLDIHEPHQTSDGETTLVHGESPMNHTRNTKPICRESVTCFCHLIT